MGISYQRPVKEKEEKVKMQPKGVIWYVSLLAMQITFLSGRQENKHWSELLKRHLYPRWSYLNRSEILNNLDFVYRRWNASTHALANVYCVMLIRYFRKFLLKFSRLAHVPSFSNHTIYHPNSDNFENEMESY